MDAAELPMELYKLSATQGVTAAIQACFQYKDTLKQDVISQVIQQMI